MPNVDRFFISNFIGLTNSLNNILTILSLNHINHTEQKNKGEFITNE